VLGPTPHPLLGEATATLVEINLNDLRRKRDMN
jgi:hypothetical protein